MLQLFETHYQTNIFCILFKLIKHFRFVIVLPLYEKLLYYAKHMYTKIQY